MQGSRLGLIAAIALLAGTAGCSLPHVLPLAGTTSPGPSPYGVWYEQHWATNALLLAAADQPEEEEVSSSAPTPESDDAALGQPMPTTAQEWGISPDEAMQSDAEAAAKEARQAADKAAAASHSAEVNAAQGDQFDNSSPYQFPASSFGPGGTPAGNPPPPNEPIRY